MGTIEASGRRAIGLYRADSEMQLAGLIGALRLSRWMRTTVTALEPYPNDPSSYADRLVSAPGPAA